jgi:hypothetical protein
MDHINIIKRAWQILWSYKILWVFGLILALTATSGGGSSAGSGSSSGSGNNLTGIYQVQSFDELQIELGELGEGVEALADLVNSVAPAQIISIILSLIVVLLCLAIVFTVIFKVLHYVSQTALIQLVDEYERTGEKHGFRKGFRIGWSRSAFRLFLIKLIITIPTVIVFIVLFFIAVVPLALWFTDNSTAGIIGTVISVGLLILTTILLIAAVAALTLLVQFFWRACVLEKLGVFESIKQGWYIVRHNLLDVFVMWLIMAGICIGWVIFIIFAMIILLPVFILLILVGAVIGAVPGLIVYGLTSLFLEGALPIIIGVLVGLPIFILVIISPIVILSALMEVFKSSVWTLTYRQLLEMERVNSEPIPLEHEGLPDELEKQEEPGEMENSTQEQPHPEIE